MRRLLTLRIIAQWTNQTHNTVRGWAKDGKIKPVACDVRTKAGLYDMDDIKAEHFRDTPQP